MCYTLWVSQTWRLNRRSLPCAPSMNLYWWGKKSLRLHSTTLPPPTTRLRPTTWTRHKTVLFLEADCLLRALLRSFLFIFFWPLPQFSPARRPPRILFNILSALTSLPNALHLAEVPAHYYAIFVRTRTPNPDNPDLKIASQSIPLTCLIKQIPANPLLRTRVYDHCSTASSSRPSRFSSLLQSWLANGAQWPAARAKKHGIPPAPCNSSVPHQCHLCLQVLRFLCLAWYPRKDAGRRVCQQLLCRVVPAKCRFCLGSRVCILRQVCV